MTEELVHLASRIGVAAANHGAGFHKGGRIPEQWRSKSAALLKKYFFETCIQLECKELIEGGAHGAETSMEFVQEIGGRAIAFEANPHTFTRKTELAAAQGVDVRNIGLGKKPGKLDFHIPNAKVDLAPGRASFLSRGDASGSSTIPVEMTTLDEAAIDAGLGSSVALWLDVEGLALEVLEGGTRLLRESVKVILVEVESASFWESRPTTGDVNRHLLKAGFHPVMRDAEYPNQYNIIYVRVDDTERIDEQILGYWHDLAKIRLSRIRLAEFTGHAVSLKARLTRDESSRMTTLTHRVAARFGSKSSADYLGDRAGSIY